MVRNSMCRYLAFAVGVAVLALAGGARADGGLFGGARTDGGLYGQPVGPGYDYRFTQPFTWTGFYFGGNLGGGWSSGNFTDSITTSIFTEDNSGVVGGIQLGYLYQIRTFVIGAEWDVDWTSISHRGLPTVVAPIGTLQAFSETNWVTSLAARLGVVGDTWMGYVKLGEGWVNGRASVVNLNTLSGVSVSGTQSGFLVGGGLSYAFTANWIGRVEYDFIDLGSSNVGGFIVNERFGLDHNLQILKAGLDFKF